MDSSTARRASPLCLDLTFPSGATQEKEKKKKKNSSKASGSFCHVSLQTTCLHAHIRPWERQTQRQIHTARTQMYTQHTRAHTHTHARTEKENILPGSLGLSCCLILIHLQN